MYQTGRFYRYYTLLSMHKAQSYLGWPEDEKQKDIIDVHCTVFYSPALYKFFHKYLIFH